MYCTGQPSPPDTASATRSQPQSTPPTRGRGRRRGGVLHHLLLVGLEGRLQRFLAPQVAQLIASSDGHAGLLDSHRREVTVVFCDLRGFTAFTEKRKPNW